MRPAEDRKACRDIHEENEGKAGHFLGPRNTDLKDVPGNGLKGQHGDHQRKRDVGDIQFEIIP